MTNQERNIIISIWDDVDLRQKLEDNPYSLTQDELVSLENNDRLGVSETLCMRFSPCGLDGSFIEPFWV
jgi:hypothetical protein